MRYVKVELGGWDYHDNLYGKLPSNASKLDKGLSSLLTHLSEKGLLDSTLVVVSTEFGRKPGVNPNKGRDHHPDGFTSLMAGELLSSSNRGDCAMRLRTRKLGYRQLESGRVD